LPAKGQKPQGPRVRRRHLIPTHEKDAMGQAARQL
jgi:hypothetical protein